MTHATAVALVRPDDLSKFAEDITGAGALVPDVGGDVGSRVTVEVRDVRTGRSLRFVAQLVEVPERRGQKPARVRLLESDRAADRLQRFAAEAA